MDSNTIPKTFVLNNGIEMPSIGMGTYAIPELDKVLYESIKNGLRMIDTAWFYGNEKEVGIGVNKAIADGLVKREDMFIVTKLWYTKKHEAEASLKESLQNLNLSYIDLYLDHWPFTMVDVDGTIQKTPLTTLWKQMEGFVKQGYVKSIGVSNYNVQALMEIMAMCEILPAVNEVEFHPYLYQSGLLEYCNRYGIKLLAFNSLCRGKYIKVGKRNQEVNLNLLEEKVILETAEKLKKTPGQIALNWSLSQGILVIPSSSKPSRFTENMEAGSFRLSNEEIAQIGELDKGYRFCPSTIQPGITYDLHA